MKYDIRKLDINELVALLGYVDPVKYPQRRLKYIVFILDEGLKNAEELAAEGKEQAQNKKKRNELNKHFEEISKIYERVLTCIPAQFAKERLDYMRKFAKVALQAGAFDCAMKFCDYLIAENRTDEDAYFTKLLARMSCRNESEMLSSSEPIDRAEEFIQILSFSANPDYYIDLIDRQQKTRLENESKAEKARLDEINRILQKKQSEKQRKKESFERRVQTAKKITTTAIRKIPALIVVLVIGLSALYLAIDALFPTILPLNITFFKNDISKLKLALAILSLLAYIAAIIEAETLFPIAVIFVYLPIAIAATVGYGIIHTDFSIIELAGFALLPIAAIIGCTAFVAYPTDAFGREENWIIAVFAAAFVFSALSAVIGFSAFFVAASLIVVTIYLLVLFLCEGSNIEILNSQYALFALLAPVIVYLLATFVPSFPKPVLFNLDALTQAKSALLAPAVFFCVKLVISMTAKGDGDDKEDGIIGYALSYMVVLIALIIKTIISPVDTLDYFKIIEFLCFALLPAVAAVVAYYLIDDTDPPAVIALSAVSFVTLILLLALQPSLIIASQFMFIGLIVFGVAMFIEDASGGDSNNSWFYLFLILPIMHGLSLAIPAYPDIFGFLGDTATKAALVFLACWTFFLVFIRYEYKERIAIFISHFAIGVLVLIALMIRLIIAGSSLFMLAECFGYMLFPFVAHGVYYAFDYCYEDEPWAVIATIVSIAALIGFMFVPIVAFVIMCISVMLLVAIALCYFDNKNYDINDLLWCSLFSVIILAVLVGIVFGAGKLISCVVG